MVSPIEQQLKSLSGRDIIVIGVMVLAYLICVNEYSQEHAFFMFGLGREAWLVAPLLIPFVYIILFAKVMPETTTGIIMEDPYFLMREYWASPTRMFLGEPAGELYVEEWLPNPKTGDMLFFVRENGKRKILIMDGRKNPPGNSRAYGLMAENQLYSYGFKSYSDIFRKVGRTGSEISPLTQLSSVLEPEQLTQILAQQPDMLKQQPGGVPP